MLFSRGGRAWLRLLAVAAAAIGGECWRAPCAQAACGDYVAIAQPQTTSSSASKSDSPAAAASSPCPAAGCSTPTHQSQAGSLLAPAGPGPWALAMSASLARVEQTLLAHTPGAIECVPPYPSRIFHPPRRL